ncbi:uncharacterized protein LOC119189673 [Manduca sexta]|uniref:uncharacterized protein LOC119189673 n=1 Tax=Manduca sexta TaxID=7130 RepID=UPI00188F6426|nr:uncharacterized protein LOC119189673 [Manduca sexta]
MLSSSRLATAVLLMSLAVAASAIKCWKCGQYSDGVGSITPCNNHSAARLEDCPHDSKFCIKYVSELTIVRDCVPTCSEKEWWGARTYCCDSDECNGSFARTASAPALLLALSALIFAR